MSNQATARDYELAPVKFSRLTRRGVLLGLSGSQLVVVGFGAIVLVFALYFGGGASLMYVVPVLLLCAALAFDRRRRPQARRVAARSSADGCGARPAGNCCSAATSSSLDRPARCRLPGDAARLRQWFDPETGAVMVHDPHTRDADRDRRRHPPGVHPARPDRAAAPGHELGPRARHRLPLRAHRLLAGDGADPARLRQGPRRVVVPARHATTTRGPRRRTANSSTAPDPLASVTRARSRSRST